MSLYDRHFVSFIIVDEKKTRNEKNCLLFSELYFIRFESVLIGVDTKKSNFLLDITPIYSKCLQIIDTFIMCLRCEGFMIYP